MNILPKEKRVQILKCITEGLSMRATARLVGVRLNTVAKLLVDAGKAALDFNDRTMRGLKCRRIQCDEIWSFVGMKEKNVPAERKGTGVGDIWTWVGMCADTKLVPCWFIGTRDAGCASEFMGDLASRLTYRVQLTTDGHKAYLIAVEDAFGGKVDYAMLVKLYGNEAPIKVKGQWVSPSGRYSPGECCGTRTDVVCGLPDTAHVSTSFVERQNLTMRMGMRRFTRLTNGFSKKADRLAHGVALHYFNYNFCRVHMSLGGKTPAMAAGITPTPATLGDLVDML